MGVEFDNGCENLDVPLMEWFVRMNKYQANALYLWRGGWVARVQCYWKTYSSMLALAADIEG